MTTPRLLLPALDAQNPLGFLAAIGLLRVLDEHAQRAKRARPSLSFVDDGQMTPELRTPLAMSEVFGVVLEDASNQGINPILNLAYTDDGKSVRVGDDVARRDLKPSPEIAAEILAVCAQDDRRVADLAAGLFSELVQDNNGNTKPTALHFTAGQQAFLSMVNDLRVGLTEECLREALEGPWRNESSLPSLAWDSSVTRLYALRASDPSGEKRGSVPAANWLGVQALAFFPVVVRRGRLVTTCVEGRWKSSVFTWPIWSPRLTVPVVSSLLRINVGKLTATERMAAGIETVFSAKILRSDQGGYGSFSPADVVVPAAATRRKYFGDGATP